MSPITKEIAKIVCEKGINLSNLSRKTNIPYSTLYSSLGDEKRNRDLRDIELIKVCKFLEIDPMDLANKIIA